MKRRAFITLLGGAAAWPLAARAQQWARTRRIGVLTTFAENDASVQSWQAAFRKTLEQAGWQEGRNIQSIIGGPLVMLTGCRYSSENWSS
jgi:putative ABC transport system substrate-binding protein